MSIPPAVPPADIAVRVRPREVHPRAEPTWDNSTVLSHEVIDGYYHRVLLDSPSIAGRAAAGQFVMITVPSTTGERILLPRPMAIHRRHASDGTLEVIFSVYGRGTAALARIAVGDSLLLTGPLGRGFEVAADASEVLLIAHGSGICAVMTVAEDMRARGVATFALLSTAFRSTALGAGDCAELGVEAIFVAEDDGSSEIRRVEEVLRQRFDTAPPSVIMVCGSGALVRAAVGLGRHWSVPVQVSLEAHMACGLGYCHGCAAPIADSGLSDVSGLSGVNGVNGLPSASEGPLVCRDGPVFDASFA